MKKEKNPINEEINKEINKEIIVMLIPIILVIIIEIVFKLCNGGIINILNTNVNAFVFTILVTYTVYGVLISVTKKSSTSIKIILIVSFITMIINQIKIIYTGEPIYFSDLNFLGKTGELTSMISTTMLPMILKYILVFFIIAIIFFIIIIKSKKNEIEVENKKIRIGVGSISFIIILLLFIPIKNMKNIYLEMFFQVSKYKDYASYTTNLDYYTTHTLLSGMYGVLLNNQFIEPKDYNEEELNRQLGKNNIENNREIGKPNIIVMFSESFWDIDKLEEIEFDKKVASNFKELEKEGKKVELLTCAYGGMSENVTFELLTGGSLNYFTKGYIPVVSFYKRKNSEKAPSIIKELNKNNYKTEIIFGSDYYDSEKSLKKMGFYGYLDLEKNNVSDEYITDLMIERLKNKKDEEKLFCMAETIQNHMPYTKSKYDNYDIKIENSNLDEDINNTILSYSQGIYDADKQLKRLYEYIKTYNEPTILIFLGDHLPYLYTEKGKNAIESLKYFNVENEIEKRYKMYNTQALILSNYEINYERIPQYLSNDLLLTYIINNMDIEIVDYYKWLYKTIEDLPSTNSFLALDKDSRLYDINNMALKMEEIYRLKEKMQYKFFIKETE